MLRPVLQRLTDLTLVSVVPGVRLYTDGFGDREALEAIVDHIAHYRADEPPAVEVHWEGRVNRKGRIETRRGWFTSPMAARMPAESKRGLVEELRLVGTADDSTALLLLAATGEEGFWLRRRFAAPLVRRGYTVLLLENPFYGKRRPAGQLGPALRTVEAQFAMNLSTVEEGRALLAWLRARGHRQIGVSGFSQGGVMAAFAAALVPFAVATVPRCAGNSATPIFTNAALSRRIDWERLGREMGGRKRAKRYFEECLAPVQLDRFDPPMAPDAAILVSARGDGFIPASEAQALHDHWPGSELRWLDTFHVAAGVMHSRAYHSAIEDAFANLGRRG